MGDQHDPTTKPVGRRTLPTQVGNATRRPVSPGWRVVLDPDGAPVYERTRPQLPPGQTWVRTRDGLEARPHPFLLA